jgi:voltage-gated potassium channel Kch
MSAAPGQVGGLGAINKGRRAAANNAARAKNGAAMRRRGTVTPGKTLEMTATAQLWYKWGQGADAGEVALSEPVPCDRQVINSKSAAATFQETIRVSFAGAHRHHVSIIVTFTEKTHGMFAQCELHARKYLKDPDAASTKFNESCKFKTADDQRKAEMSPRWYSGVVGFVVRMGGAEYGALGTGEGKSSASAGGGGTKIVPDGGGSGDTVTFEVFIKSLMQAPAAASEKAPEEIAAEKKHRRNQLKQVFGALVTIMVFLGSGAIFFPLVEGWTVLDAFYFGMVTITTVGYGDMGPVTVSGRIFTSFFVLGGVGIIGVALGIVGGYVIEQQQKIQAEIIKRAQALALAEHDTDSSDSEGDTGGLSPLEAAAKKKAELQAALNASPVGCLWKFGKRWLKVFLPVIFTLSIGMAFLISNEPMDPQLEETLLVYNATHNETRYILHDHLGAELYNSTESYRMTFVNALYFGLVTGTTVGYGDISPSTDEGKIFCIFFLIFAVITTANALSTLGDALVTTTGNDQVMNILDKKLTAEFLMSLDMDGSGDVNEFEYLSAMLIRLNHVDEGQIDSIMKAFRKLDVDGSGSLSVQDLAGNLKSERKKKKKEGMAAAAEDANAKSAFIPGSLEKEAAADRAWSAPPESPTNGDVVAQAEALLGEKEGGE